MFSRTYTHNKLINLTRNKVTIQSNNCTALPTWVNQNLLTNIIPGIRGSTVNSFTGPLYKILAAGRTQGWTILDHAWTHQVCSVLPTEWDREWQKKGKPYAWGKGIYIHPKKKKKKFIPSLPLQHWAQHFNTNFGLQPLTADAQIETPGIYYRPPVEVSRTCRYSTFAVRKYNLGEVLNGL